MGTEDSPRRTLRKTSLETLEDRVVMSADPLTSGLLEAHTLSNADLEQHGGLASDDAELAQHVQRTADFWLDTATDHDIDLLLGNIEQTLASAHGVTSLTQARNAYGFVGTGQTVAVIDSGIAWDHVALGGGMGPNYRVVGGWDFSEENDANPYDDGPAGSHGTHVAGIVGASAKGLKDTGVAPGVDLVGLRVFNDAGEGYYAWVEKALRWVHENRNAFENPITAVNLSLGTSWNASTVPFWSTMEDELAQLKADGIFISVSAGNSFATYNTPGLSYPAASPSVVPVMSVDDSGQLSSFSQRHTRAIAAPGRYIMSTVPDYIGNHNNRTDDYASFSGTSMAAPYVAGASVLVREAMQFVSMTGITQDTIYNHLMATADSVFDAATGQTYKRLNLNNAISALMPSDDFGSNVADAYNLGTLSGASEFSGLIGKLDDVDSFRFTASASGTISFTVDATHGMKPLWSASIAGAVSGTNGETYTLQVVAGQSYSIGLSTGGPIGYYEISVDAASAFTYVDWGTITQSQTNNVANAGKTWYRFEASRTGYLTGDALFTATGGNVDLALYDANLNPLATGTATATGERVDLLATTGTEYFLCVSGTNSDVDFRLTNLVSIDGVTVSVVGTAAADAFSFTAGTTQHVVGVNGTKYQFNAAAFTAFNIAGGADADTIAITGTAGNETATVRAANTTLVGAGLRVTAGDVENVTVRGGGGADSAIFHDTAGDDVFRATPTNAVMSGAGYQHSAFGFNNTLAYATAGGDDRAYLHDGATDDRFLGRPEFAALYGSNNEFYNYAGGFDRVYAYATAGGTDVAYLYDSAGNDRFVGRPEYAILSGKSNEFYNYAGSFDRVYAYASTGNDEALLYDGATNDQLIARPEYALLRAGNNAFYNYAAGFDRVVADAGAGGFDDAYLYDSAENDRFVSRRDYGLLQGVGNEFYNYATNFDRLYAFATAGGTDDAYLYDGAGDDRFVGRPEYALLYAVDNSFYNYAANFKHVYSYATAGGNDKAFLYDGANDDRYIAGANYAHLYSVDGRFSHYASGFDQARAYATAGGTDYATLYDGAGNDRFSGRAESSIMEDAGGVYYNLASGFHRVFAYATAGGVNSASLYDSAANDVVLARDDFASLSAGASTIRATGFSDVTAFGLQGGADTVDESAVDFVFERVGKWS